MPKFSRIGLFKIEVSLTITHQIYTNIIYINIFAEIHITELTVHIFVTPISVELSRLFHHSHLRCNSEVWAMQMHSVLYRLGV